MSALDINVVANASGGRALRAFKILGSDAPVIGPHVLETPSNIAIRGSLDPQRTEEFRFTTSDQYKDFFKQVTTMGWNAALNVDAECYLGKLKFNFSAKNDGDKQVEKKHSKKARNMVVTQCLYVPMKCFQIPQSQMFLTKSAIADAKAVSTEADAAKFIEKYNTHVYAGLYHIGGIFIREVSVASSEEVDEDYLTKKGLKAIKVSGEVSSDKYAVKVKADASYNEDSSDKVDHQVSHDVKISKSEEKIHVWGATSATKKDDFLKLLEADPSKWAIIDKAFEHPHDLIGIWDIMNKYEDLEKPAKLISDCFEKLKEKEKQTQDVKKEDEKTEDEKKEDKKTDEK